MFVVQYSPYRILISNIMFYLVGEAQRVLDTVMGTLRRVFNRYHGCTKSFVRSFYAKPLPSPCPRMPKPATSTLSQTIKYLRAPSETRKMDATTTRQQRSYDAARATTSSNTGAINKVGHAPSKKNSWTFSI